MRDSLKPLRALDALFLHLETAATPMHVGALLLLDAAERNADEALRSIRDHLVRRMHLSPVFGRRLGPIPLALANPIWIDGGPVDLDQHVQRLTLSAPGSHAQLETLIAVLHAEPLPRDRPLWQMTLIDGLEDGRLALFAKIHHATLDGAAGVALARVLLDTAATSRDLPPAPGGAARPAPTRFQLLGAALRTSSTQTAKLARALPEVARTAAGVLQGFIGGGRDTLTATIRRLALAPPAPFNRAIDSARTVATLSMPLAAVQGIAAAFDVKLNDVVLAMVSGAVRRYLAERDALPGQSLIVAMPVSLRARGDAEANTQATLALAALATDIADPVDRLRAIQQASGGAKRLVDTVRRALAFDVPSIGLPWLLTAAAVIYGKARVADRIPSLANLVVSNVRGPAEPLYLAGMPVLASWPLSIVEHGLGLNITLQSYAGSLDFGLVAARRSVPDLAPLVAGLHAAYEELAAAALTQPAQAPGGRRKKKSSAQHGHATATKRKAGKGRASTRR